MEDTLYVKNEREQSKQIKIHIQIKTKAATAVLSGGGEGNKLDVL